MPTIPKSIVANSDWVRIRWVVGSCFGATDCLFRESGAAQHEAMHSQQPVLACVRWVMPMVSLRMTVSCCWSWEIMLSVVSTLILQPPASAHNIVHVHLVFTAVAMCARVTARQAVSDSHSRSDRVFQSVLTTDPLEHR